MNGLFWQNMKMKNQKPVNMIIFCSFIFPPSRGNNKYVTTNYANLGYQMFFYLFFPFDDDDVAMTMRQPAPLPTAPTERENKHHKIIHNFMPLNRRECVAWLERVAVMM